MSIKESNEVLKIKKHFQSVGAYVEKIWGGGFQAEGIPDLIMCYEGLFVGIEVKVKKNEPSEIQKAKLKQIIKSGGLGICLWLHCELSDSKKEYYKKQDFISCFDFKELLDELHKNK